MNRWWSMHTHSKFSLKDALPSVPDMVDRAKELGYPGLGLTDHGSVGGIVQLYKAARAADIVPFPGMEAYLRVSVAKNSAFRKNFHACIVATSTAGWHNLIGLNNLAMKQFHHKPVLDFNNLATLSSAGLLDGLWITTGCWFGVVASSLRSPDPTSANNIMTALVNYFDSRVLVELQNHGVSDAEHDDVLHVKFMAALARRYGLPIVTTSDSHYLREQDVAAHNTLKRLVSWSDEPEDAVFPGDGYWMPSHEQMAARFDADIFNDSVSALTELVNTNTLRVSELDTFSIQVPRVTQANPDVTLRARCEKALATAPFPKSKQRIYQQRLEDELSVITGAGFSPYMLLVAELCDWMAASEVFYTARGSASGSLVCWLLGISQFDPIKFGCRFDRFLSTDRLKPPDIDLDVDKERRDDVLQWLNEQFSMMQIGLYSRWGLNADDNGKGSLIRAWQQMARKQHRDPYDMPAEVNKELVALSKHKAYSNVGVHAAGVVVVSNEAQLARVPTSYVASSQTFVSAWSGDDVEAMGYVKVDVLSVGALSAIRRALATAGLTLADIPLESMTDSRVYRRIAKGETHSLFQLGGVAQMYGCKELKPSKFDDLVAALALFRPAVDPSDYIDRKHGLRGIPQRHELLMDVTKDTYGVLLYQEQIMAVLRALGMDAEQLTATLKAIKSSNTKTSTANSHMTSITQAVSDMCAAAGFDDVDTQFFLEALRGYGEYGFNKSHAVSYARVAYITAWLAVYHPVAWWAAELATCGPDSVTDNVREARRYGIRILRPDINLSDELWTPDVEGNAIRKGLLSVNKVGDVKVAEILRVRRAGGPFTSIDDLVARCSSHLVSGGREWIKHRDITRVNGTLRALYEEGVLESLLAKENT